MSDITSRPDQTPPILPRMDADRTVVEQAKGALMLCNGISSCEAFALLLTWSREKDTTLHTIADTLMNGACQGGGSDLYDPELVGWLRQQLSDDLSGPALW